MSVARVYLSPGLFGFSTLGSYEYFTHVHAGIQRRYAEAGREVQVHLVDVHPTASIRRRSRKLVEHVESTAGDSGPIHLLGHSTGGLDARLVASPSVNLYGLSLAPAWADRIRSVTSMNTPHYGTPMASFFATLSGQRLLYALSALTVVMLKVGSPPLALTSSLIASLAAIEKPLGLHLRLIDELTERLVRVLDDAASRELSEYLTRIRQDQGAIIQLTPESMDLFQAGVENRDGVQYYCTASYVDSPGVVHLARWLMPPWSNLSLPVFAVMYRLTALENPIYPSSSPGTEADDALRRVLGTTPVARANDGVVPLRSQIWGRLIWAGLGDHLDVVGHFEGLPRSGHADWLGSGAGFDSARFEDLMDAIVDAMMRSE